MEQPTTGKKQETADEMQSIDLNTDRKDPTQNYVPAPDAKPDGGVPKPVDKDNADVNAPSTVDLKERLGGEERNSTESAAEGLKSKKSVRWSEELVMESPIPRDAHRESGNPYVDYPAATAPADSSSSFNFKETMGTVKDVLGKWRKKVGEATRKAEDFAGNTWQHLKTSPSLTDAALGRIAQGTKVLAEGGYEKIFRQTFEIVPEEQLQNSFACYLSTSAGPVMGVLYISTAKLAFCSDNPLSYQSDDKTEWSYYKVVIPLHQLKAINPSTSRTNPAEKYIQVISVDNHEFWFMGFLKYGAAVECLQRALQVREEQSV